MKRRNFLVGSSGIVAAQIAASKPASAAASALQVARRSRLFDNAGASPNKTFIQDVVYWNDLIYCLYTDAPKHYQGITATTPHGQTSWHYDLPKGVYLSIGIEDGHVLLHALTYETQGRILQNCLLRLQPGNQIELLNAPAGSLTGRFFFAGDSTLLRIAAGTLEIWRAEDANVQRTTSAAVAVPLQAHVDLLSTGTLAVTRRDETSITVVDAQSGSVNERAITLPEVAAALGSYRANSDSSRGEPVVIPATGTDYQGTLYALIFPSVPSAVTTARFDSHGNGALWASLQFPPRVATESIAPFKLLVHTTEIGVVYSDGRVAWYSA